MRLGLGFALLLSACIGSNVVAVEQREVGSALDGLTFRPVAMPQLDGFYESVDIRGDAAVSLRRIYYVFDPRGSYTAAALTEVEGALQFQTLNGTWSASAAGLSLDGQAPVACETAPEHVRLAAPNGVVVLRQGRLQ